MHVISALKLRLLPVAFLLMASCELLLLLGSIHAGLPFNPINLPLERQLRLRVFLPQGWKFFTKDPREERIDVLVKTDPGIWRSGLAGTNASSTNLFGLKRNTRAKAVEVGLITTSIMKDQWVACEKAPGACAENIPVTASLKNPSPNPTLCGQVCVVKQTPLPWAWSRSNRKITLHSSCAKVYLSCF